MADIEPQKKQSPPWVDALWLGGALSLIFGLIWYFTPEDPNRNQYIQPSVPAPDITYHVGDSRTLNEEGKKKFLEMLSEEDPEKRKALQNELHDSKYEDKTSKMNPEAEAEWRKLMNAILNEKDPEKRKALENQLLDPKFAPRSSPQH